jgi:3',5'-cyclic AMP phosphodiesterase CpdA
MFGTVVVLGEVEPAKFITTMDVFPDEVRIGDTIYLVIKCSNNTDTDRYCQVPEPNNLFQHSGDSIRYFVLVDNEEWEIIVPVVLVIHGHVLVPPYVLVPSGKTVSTYTSGFRFNELEDLHSNFWVNSIKKLPEQGKEITFKVLIQSGFGVVDRRYPLIFNKKIKLKPRPNNEMTIFEKWYRNTPQKTFPNLYEEKQVQNISLFGNENLNVILVFWSHLK